MLAAIRNPSRAKILALENEMVKQPGQLDLDVQHYFSGGLYARELFIPKGTLLTGRVHKTDHLNFLMKGDIEVMTDTGIKRLTAPAIIPAKAGIKRVGYAYEDSIWVSVHATEETDMDRVEDTLVEPMQSGRIRSKETMRLDQ